MDINDWRGISTIFVLFAFIGICWWAFSPKRRKRFEADAQLPFADEEQHKKQTAKPDNSDRDKT